MITNIQSRKRIIIDKHLCFKCLGSGHKLKNCTPRMKCFKSGNNHYIALSQEQQNLELQTQGELRAISCSNNQSILLQIASTYGLNENDRIHNCRILFNNCSQLCYISPDLYSKLKLESIGTENINIKTYGNNNTREK